MNRKVIRCEYKAKTKEKKLTLSEYSTTSRIDRGNPDIRYAFAAGAILISNIRTSVTIFDDSCEKSCISTLCTQNKRERESNKYGSKLNR